MFDDFLHQLATKQQLNRNNNDDSCKLYLKKRAKPPFPSSFFPFPFFSSVQLTSEMVKISRLQLVNSNQYGITTQRSYVLVFVPSVLGHLVLLDHLEYATYDMGFGQSEISINICTYTHWLQVD